MSNVEKEMIIVFIIAVTVVSVIFLMFTAVNENQNEKNLKKPMQKVVSTEIETHEIRCVEHTSNFCAKYKVFKIIKE